MNALNQMTVRQWLKLLMAVEAAGAMLNLAGSLLNAAGWLTWPLMGLNVASVLCLYMLWPLSPMLKKAALYQAIALCMSMIRMDSLLLLTLAGVICNVAAWLHLCSGFSEAAEPCDPKLAKHWKNYFLVWLLSGLAVGAVVAVLGMGLTMDEAMTGTVIAGANGAVNLAVKGIYILLLLRTCPMAEANDLEE